MSTGSLEGVEAELVATLASPDVAPDEGRPFHVVLPGDWSGRANRSLFASSQELSSWRPRFIDRDNLDQVIASLGVKLTLPGLDEQAPPITIDFARLDDFHPDRLYERLEIFESLRRTRDQLSNPGTFAQAAAEVSGWQNTPAIEVVHDEIEPAKAVPSQPISADNLLDQILDNPSLNTSERDASPSAISPEISELARAAVQPYLSPDIDADQDKMIATVDERIATQLRAIMHHPDFQALEAAWRAVDFLVMRLHTGSELKLFLLDISFDELKNDLSEGDVRATALYKLLVEQTVETPGAVPWSVIAGNYTFDLAGDDAGLLERLSVIANLAGAPFVAATTTYLLGCESLAKTPDPDDWQEKIDSAKQERWASLKAMPSSGYIGLALPRFLLRLPYGKDTDETEELAFEELAQNEDAHESYLWANPVFAIAFLLSKGFSEEGWGFRPSDFLEIEGLPMHVYQSDGDSQIKPCAEVLLTLRAAERIIDQGFMPLLSLKNTETVRLGMVQSISGSRLAGPWNISQ